MSGLIEIHGGIPRTQDYATLKQQEDLKAGIQQTEIGMRRDEQTQTKASNVHKSDDTENYTPGYDASEKGNGQYSGDGGQNKKKEEPKNGNVQLKRPGGIDIKI